MAKRWLLLAALALGVVVLAAWLSGSFDKATRNPPTAAAADQTFPLNLQWHTGLAQQYRLLSDSSMHMEAATSSRSSIDVQLHGLLDTLTLKDGQDEAIVGMRLSSVELKINGTVDTEINRALSAPFRVHFAADGMPVAFDYPAEVSTQNRKLLENMVRMFQVSIDGSDTWTAQESNGNGSYEAVYRRSGPWQVDKSKRKFSPPPVSMLVGADITSTEQVRIDPAYDWISMMNVDEKLQTTSQNGPAMTIKNLATLELQPGVQLTVTPDIWRFEAAAAIDDTVAKITHPVPDISAEEAHKRIKSTIAELDKSKQGRLVLVHHLRDLLRVDDSQPAVLLDILQTQQLSDRTRADLYLVFEQAGTDSAQAALVSVFTDNNNLWSLLDSMRAIVAMGGVDEPNKDSVAALWNTAQSTVSDSDSQRIASAATFALGSLGNTMHASSNPGYDSLRSNLLSNALNGINDKQRSDFVFALGNTQDSTLAHEIVALLDDNAPSIRRATALSLGMLGVDQVADTMVSRYQQNTNSQIRSAITESLASWSQPTVSAMAMFRQTVKTEADESTRYNIAILLGKNMAKFPENEATLREVMRSEPSKRIRQKVADMLSGP